MSDATPSDDGFAAAVALVLAHEGGFQAMPDDPGNWTGGKIGAGALNGTKYGISAATYPTHDIAALTAADAAAIYRRDFWDRWGLAQLPPAIAGKLLDAAVNIGIDDAVRCLQRALRAAGQALAEDGKLGEATLAAAAAVPPALVLPALREALAGHYRLIAARQPGEARFLTGWLARAYS
ncbi:MAG TPA: glycosyl hydrolase 108 family protein [Stellaceae bacterium]|jgi:lysozyme family protein|nr:glycosyl hydrolase 108 family protein [Stellaceae bacterium]